MNGRSMHKATAALALQPRCARGSAAGLFAFGQIAEEILAALLRGRGVGKRSGINPQCRYLCGLPGQAPGGPSTGRPIRGLA